MVRRIILLAAMGLALLATPALAQDVGGDSPGATVAPNVIEQAPPDTVEGVVLNRPLPRTGGDFGPEVLFGAGLTAAGLAFAVSARVRRQRVTAHTAS
jgi:hypothetical protein